MKISKSKQELARIVSENGGWRNGEFAAQDGDGGIGGYEVKPEWDSLAKYWWREASGQWFFANKIKNHHQTVLSRAEYFHIYPLPDADVAIAASFNPCADGFEVGGVMAQHTDSLISESNVAQYTPRITAVTTIEQLAADYRNAKDYAERKQQEADAAKADAEAKLAELVAAGKALGLVLGVADAAPVATKFTGKFHSAKHGDRPSDLDMICDGCGRRFGHHVGFDCRP